MEFLEAIAKLAERDPLSVMTAIAFAIFWYSQRNQERDDKNISAALTLTSAIVATFQPLGESLREIANIVKDGKRGREQIAQSLEEKAKTMVDVTARRDEQHREVLARLEAQQKAIEAITRQITIATDENTLRHEVSKAVLLINDMASSIRTLSARQITDPAEHETSAPEKKTEPQEAKEN